jgi:hypothetical protein
LRRSSKEQRRQLYTACALPRRFPFNLLPPGFRFDVCLHREATPCVVCSCARARSVWQLASGNTTTSLLRGRSTVSPRLSCDGNMGWHGPMGIMAGAPVPSPCPCLDRDGNRTTREQSPASSPPSDAPRLLLVRVSFGFGLVAMILVPCT